MPRRFGRSSTFSLPIWAFLLLAFSPAAVAQQRAVVLNGSTQYGTATTAATMPTASRGWRFIARLRSVTPNPNDSTFIIRDNGSSLIYLRVFSSGGLQAYVGPGSDNTGNLLPATPTDFIVQVRYDADAHEVSLETWNLNGTGWRGTRNQSASSLSQDFTNRTLNFGDYGSGMMTLQAKVDWATFLSGSGMYSGVPPSNPTAGNLISWSFDANSGADATGNAPLTFTGSPTFEDTPAPPSTFFSGRSVSLDGSTQYLSGASPASSVYDKTANLEQGTNFDLPYDNLRLNYTSDQTLFEMEGFGRLWIPANTSQVKLTPARAGGGEVSLTITGRTSGVLRFGAYIGPYTSNDSYYLRSWDRALSVSSKLSNSVATTDSSPFNLSSRQFTLGARTDGTQRCRVDLVQFRWTNTGLPDHWNRPRYFNSGSSSEFSLGWWLLENNLTRPVGSGVGVVEAMDVTLVNNGSAPFIDTPNVKPEASAGPDQTKASTGTFRLDGSRSFDVDATDGALTPAAYVWTQTSGPTLNIEHPASEVTDVSGAVAGQTYQFQLVVTDDAGEQSVADSVTVTCANLSSGMTPERTTLYAGQVLIVRPSSAEGGVIDFTDAAGRPGVEYDFGDAQGEASKAYEPEAAHAYTNAGTYTVTQTVRDAAGNAQTATAQITVLARPTTFALTINVPAGGNIQDALDTAKATSGDVLIRTVAGTYNAPSGGYILKKKVDNATITWRSEQFGSAQYPSAQNRVVDGAQSSLLTYIQQSNVESSVIVTEVGQPVANYFIEGLDLHNTVQSTAGMVMLGYHNEQQTLLSQQPRDIVFDHCIVRGPVANNIRVRRAFFVNSKLVSILNSVIDEIHDDSQSQGISINNTEGGVVIYNSRVSATGENVFSGGSVPAIVGVIPSDIAVIRSHLLKHMKWDKANPAGQWDGSNWDIENNLEWKAARYARMVGNVYENCWVQGTQSGHAINLNNILDSGEWTEIQWASIWASKIVNAGRGLTLRGRDERIMPNVGATVMRHIRVRDVLLTKIGDTLIDPAASGHMSVVLRGIGDLSFNHMTSDQDGVIASIGASDGEKLYKPRFLNIAAPHKDYGFKGDGVNPGNPTFDAWTTGVDFRGNAIPGAADIAPYPAGGLNGDANHYPAASAWPGFFVNYPNDFTPVASGTLDNTATDGGDIGANISLVDAATVYTVSGQWSQSTPSAPSGLKFVTTSSCNSNGVTGYLTWLDNSNDETGFVVEARVKTNGVYGDWSQAAAVGANVTNSGSLTVKFETQYRVRAVNGSVSSSYSNTVTVLGAAICESSCTPPTSLIISEFRLRGPAGAKDEFVELYNNSDTSVTVCTADTSGGWTLAARAASGSSASPVFTIPNGTAIPGRAHYLAVNSAPGGYSLSNSPAGAGTTATGDNFYTTDIEDNVGIALFKTANPSNFTSANRLDAVGSTSETDALYREGAGYAPLSGTEYTGGIEYSFYRDTCGKGGSIPTFGACSISTPKDSNDNAVDFIFVDTNGTSAGAGQRLGAPSPENLSSPIQRNGSFTSNLLDTCAGSSSSPNRLRDFTSDPSNNSTFGTLDLRYTFTNNTGASVTRLRFRVIDITTFPATSTTADLRPRSSLDASAFVDRPPCGTGTSTITVKGTTLEMPPSQPNGGGFGSSLSAGSITLATPLANGASIDVRFLLGIQHTGSYKFYLNIEALP